MVEENPPTFLREINYEAMNPESKMKEHGGIIMANKGGNTLMWEKRFL